MRINPAVLSQLNVGRHAGRLKGDGHRPSQITARTGSHRGGASTAVPLASWLFIRDRESIWIERPADLSMIVVGPGPARAHVFFLDETALQAYQVATAERLARAGWFLWGFDRDRRPTNNRRPRTVTRTHRRQHSGAS